MGVFLGQLVGFAVIAWVVVKYIVPPAKKLMAKQQDDVRTQIAESDAAAARLEEAKKAHADAVASARNEAAKIREDARADAQRIAVAMREQADAEVERIKQHGQEQVVLQREALVRQLQAELGAAALGGADKIVRDKLADPAEQSRSVDRFLDELEAMAAKNGDAS